MEIFNKIGQVIAKRKIATLLFVVALVSFVYLTEGNLIAGALCVFFALVMYVLGMELYQEYKHLPVAKPAAVKTAKKPAAKKPAKKSKK